MRVSPRALLIVIRSCLRTREQREERYLINDVSQRLVASEAELDDALLLAASLGHGHGAGVRLQMPKRLPPPGGVPEAGPECGRGDGGTPTADMAGPEPRMPFFVRSWKASVSSDTWRARTS
jgi:hypothetical protein